MSHALVLGAIALCASCAIAAALGILRRRNLDRWLGQYLVETPKRRSPSADEPIHVLLCLCDHYEPKLGRAPADASRQRVLTWRSEYPRLFARFRDSDGRPPQHSFFYPIEEYETEYLDCLAELCHAGFGEVEIHLHHDNDSAEHLHEELERFKESLAERHGLLARHRRTGELAYGFIHGNWALNNSSPDGCWCGINDEISVLRATGCYADFTLPSAPEPAQTRKINSMYWARGDAHRPKGHDWGINVGSAPAPADALMLIQGPLLLSWRERKWGVVPRIENACLQSNQPPSMVRLDLWLRARIQVPQRPDWFFVKLHTHGANEANQRVLLGDAMVRFHEDLARRAANDARFQFHYVTAREMYNLARAAEGRWTGSVAEARDYELVRVTSVSACNVASDARLGPIAANF